MTLYVVVAINAIHNPEQFGIYATKGGALAVEAGAEFLAYGPPQAVEGQLSPERMLIMKFADQEAFDKFYHSPEYQAALPFRLNNSDTSFLLTIDDTKGV